MAKGQTTVSDFAVAPRRSRSVEQSATQAGSGARRLSCRRRPGMQISPKKLHLSGLRLISQLIA